MDFLSPDFLLIALAILVAGVIYIALKFLGVWGQIADVFDKAWLAIVLAGVLFYIGFNIEICPTSTDCPVLPCGNLDVFCWINSRAANFACNTQAGSAITMCNMFQVVIGAVGVILLIFGVAKVITNVFEN